MRRWVQIGSGKIFGSRGFVEIEIGVEDREALDVQNILKGVVERETSLADSCAVAVGNLLVGVEVVDVTDRGDNSRSSASTRLLEGLKLRHRNWSLLNLQTHILSKCAKTLIGD